MKLSLIVMTPGKMEGKSLDISLAQFVIGRDPQCHLRPASPSISKRHCALIQRDGKVFVRDFDSTNGTFVNDNQVKGEVELHNGDRMKVGPLDFQVKMEAVAAVNRPTPVPPTKAPAKTPESVAVAEKKPQSKTAMDDATSDDDSVAAMLLSLQDDGESSSGIGGLVPEGSTVMDLNALSGTDTGKKEEKKPSAPANTSNAAKALLEKYMRRPR